MTTPAAVAVVIPARDEEALLPACLDSVARAVEALDVAHPGIRARVVVVLDSCRDRSAEIVAARSGVTAVAVQAGVVGLARAAGVEAADAWACTLAPGPVWIANTDADTVVPPHWLIGQVRLAGEGQQLVVGTVRPQPGDLTVEEMEAWRERHSTADGHEHVHGANLGFSLDAYRAVGGFRPLAVHEDVDLVASLRDARVAWVATGAIPVTTSGRRSGRAPDGFAAYLGALGA